MERFCERGFHQNPFSQSRSDHCKHGRTFGLSLVGANHPRPGYSSNKLNDQILLNQPNLLLSQLKFIALKMFHLSQGRAAMTSFFTRVGDFASLPVFYRSGVSTQRVRAISQIELLIQKLSDDFSKFMFQIFSNLPSVRLRRYLECKDHLRLEP